jgi:hypothetical protein
MNMEKSNGGGGSCGSHGFENMNARMNANAQPPPEPLPAFPPQQHTHIPRVTSVSRIDDGLFINGEQYFPAGRTGASRVMELSRFQ